MDKNIPWHVSRFHPTYQFTDHPPTSNSTLKRAEGIGKDAGLSFVYVGNVYGWGGDTLCPVCKKLLIHREGFNLSEYNVQEGQCVFCHATLPGFFGKKRGDNS